LAGWFRRFRAWWTARGVIPRWQLLLVYVLVVTAGAVGQSKTTDAASKATEAAFDAKSAIRQVQAQGAQRRLVSAESQLSTCLQVESVKAQILGTIDDSVRGRHLTLEQQRQTARVRRRFAPGNCYALPVVAQAGLKPPK
jgi:hypothetical protein